MRERRLGDYAIEAELGRGGMGVVYRARHLLLGREVALKVNLDPAGHDRFQREARALAAIEHPHVVRIFDVGHDAGTPWLAMELVPGESLQARLRRLGALDERAAAEIVATLARAVAHVHAHGILHRDLKPENVLVAEDGRVVLTDFGLARDPRSDREHLTRTGATLGTPAYMAPEQAGGERVDELSDVYSLGALLYTLLAGGPPYQGSTLKVVTAVLKGSCPPLSARRPGVSPALEAICARAMATQPAARYPSAAALGEALEAFAAPGGADARRGPSRALAAGALGVLAVAGLTAMSLATPEPAPAPNASMSSAPPTAAVPPATTASRDQPAQSPPPSAARWAWRKIALDAARAYSPLRYAIDDGAAYDAARRRVLIFGGATAKNAALGDTWTWDGATWTKVLAGGPDQPPPRFGHVLVYDPLREEVLLYGGAMPAAPPDDRKALADTWLWDGERWRLPPVRDGPQARGWACAAWSPREQAALVFGGRFAPSGVRSNELWAWDGAGWRCLSEGGAGAPPGRTQGALAYDPGRERLVLYGGHGYDGMLDDLWEWDGHAWHQHEPPGGRPGRLRSARLVYAGDALLMFGGERGDGSHSDELWSWDGTRWSPLALPDPPPGLNRHSAVWDAGRDVLVVFAGDQDPGSLTRDVWELVSTR